MPLSYIQDHVIDIFANMIGANGTWTVGNGDTPKFSKPGNHGADLLWDTADHLVNSTARGIRMVQQEVIGQAGLGHTANIVVALTAGVPNPLGGKFDQMPAGGLDSIHGQYFTLATPTAPASPEIVKLIQWIEDGCHP